MRKLILIMGALVALSVPASAQATFPGSPGPIAISHFNPKAPAADGDIWNVNPSGTVSPLNGTFRIAETDPAYSPNGRFIVFVRRTDGDADIWIMRANGANPRPLVESPRRRSFSPRSSPAGAASSSRATTVRR